jgi:hypothetical protein
VNARPDSDDGKIVYWHRELPPFDAELMAEHTIFATCGISRAALEILAGHNEPALR